jgi:hypothetical protein
MAKCKIQVNNRTVDTKKTLVGAKNAAKLRVTMTNTVIVEGPIPGGRNAAFPIGPVLAKWVNGKKVK